MNIDCSEQPVIRNYEAKGKILKRDSRNKVLKKPNRLTLSDGLITGRGYFNDHNGVGGGMG